MRRKTESGNVVSSHSSACGAQLLDHERVDRLAQRLVLLGEDEVPSRRRRDRACELGRGHSGNLRAAVRVDTQMSPPSATTSPTTSRTIALDRPEKRNALSDALLDDLLAAFEHARDDDDVRCVVLTSTHEKVFSAGGDLAGFAADAPLIHKYFATDRFPRLFRTDRRARQADALRRQRPRARGRARRRAGLRPDHRQGGRALRHARDQRRDLPVHDHGADLPQRRAQEDQRAAAAGRADRRARGRADRDRQQGRARGRVRRRGRRLGGAAGGQVAAADAPRQGRDAPPAGPRARPTRSSTCTGASRSRSRPTTSRRA